MALMALSDRPDYASTPSLSLSRVSSSRVAHDMVSLHPQNHNSAQAVEVRGRNGWNGFESLRPPWTPSYPTCLPARSDYKQSELARRRTPSCTACALGVSRSTGVNGRDIIGMSSPSVLHWRRVVKLEPISQSPELTLASLSLLLDRTYSSYLPSLGAATSHSPPPSTGCESPALFRTIPSCPPVQCPRATAHAIVVT